MLDDSHPNAIVKVGDVELVLERFEDAFKASRLRNKLVIDTSAATVQQSLAEFVSKVEAFLNDHDRLRILVQAAKRRGDWP